MAGQKMRLNTPFGKIFQTEKAIDGAIQPGLDMVSVERDDAAESAVTKPSDRLSGIPRLLNIGCGYDKRPGYFNIDMDPACEPDFLVTSNNANELPSNYFEKVLAKDVLEHIPRTQTLSALLQWARYLKLGGRLELQTSSIYGVIDMMRQKETFEYHYGMTVCMFGSQAHPGDFHYTGFTEQTLRVHLLAAGFAPIKIELVDGWLYHVSAMKVEDWTAEPDFNDRIEALSARALGRTPDEHHYSFDDGRPFIDVARVFYDSPERLFYIANKFGI